MRRFEFWKLGLQNVLASSMRSVLTVLGMSIGVAAILAVITLGEAGRTQVKQDIARLGIDQVQVTAADTANLLTRMDSEYLRTALDTQVEETLCLECSITTRKGSLTATVLGFDPERWSAMAPDIAAGKSFLPWQWDAGSSVAMVGTELAERLNLSVGEWFSAGGMMLDCTGLMGECGQASQIDMRQAVVVPSALLRRWLGDTVQQLAIHVPDGVSPQQLASNAEELLQQKRDIHVHAVSMQVQAEAADSVLVVFVDVLRWVALICMVVGGIGVTNILLVSVRERRREIGVMQSLGASQMQICGLFLCEALIYALAGGILGLLLGGVLIAVAGESIGLAPVIRAGDCTAVFLAAVVLGLLSGVAPAASASRMKPVDALKDD